MTQRTVRVQADPPRRLETFVRHELPTYSRQAIHRLITAGEILVNGRRARKGHPLALGDLVTLPDQREVQPQPELPVRVVFEDEYLVIVDKPGGLRSHARDPQQRDTVAAWLCAHYPDTASSGEPLGGGLAHRLDTGTSGLLIAARSAAVFAALRSAFRERAIEKHYLAVVVGETPASMTLDAALAHDRRDRRRMTLARPGQQAWRARTLVTRQDSRPPCSVLDVTMPTGVTHQIRVQLALAGHPIVGDTLYEGPAHPALPPGRHALHARRLGFVHPITAQQISVEAPCPADVAAVLATGVPRA